jgi:hypothetical protein
VLASRICTSKSILQFLSDLSMEEHVLEFTANS